MDASTGIAFAGLSFTVVVALLGFSFQMGKLSERVTSLERQRDDDKDLFEKVIRAEGHQEKHDEAVVRIDAALEGIHRQLGNLATTMLQTKVGPTA